MDIEDMSMEEKCEHLMSVLVETRKKFGKLSATYNTKTAILENKLLDYHLETISKYQIKPKQTIPNVDYAEMTRELESFSQELNAGQFYIENVNKKINNMECVVDQLRTDTVTKKTKEPITTEAMLARAKAKHN